MTKKIVSLTGGDYTPPKEEKVVNQNIVDFLTTLLEAAKKGDIQEVNIHYDGEVGATVRFMGEYADPHKTWGMLTDLALTYRELCLPLPEEMSPTEL